MEQPETMDPDKLEIKNIIKEYELNTDKKNYRLKMSIENGNILFKIRKLNCFSYLFYLKKFKYYEILKELNLKENDYINITIVFALVESLINNNRIKIFENKDNIKMEFHIEKELKEEIKYIYLEEEIQQSKKENDFDFLFVEEIYQSKKKNDLNIIFEEVIKIRKKGATFCEILNFLNKKNYDKNLNSLMDIEKYCYIEKVKKAKEDIQKKINLLNQIKENNIDN